VATFTGIRIYLGRFLRLNSWNVFTHPFSTLRSIFGVILDLKAVLFTLCFGFFIFLTYLVVYALHCVNTEALPGRHETE